ncbi:MAG: hypothetical protein Q4B26_03110 [Eubacteriales bacterium]|nr:hypothetical protein [Eubacteriales bacterium]
MKQFLENKAFGFYGTLCAAILSLAAMIVYRGVLYRMPVVFALLGITVVLTVLAAFLSGKKWEVLNYLASVNAVLTACAAIIAVALMVNQVAYVVSGLDPMKTIMSFVVYEILAVIALLINLISSFGFYTKQ